jgi:hypothetical protein
MRYMMLVRSVVPPGPPPAAFLAAICKLSGENTRNGKLTGGGQFGGVEASARVRLAGGKIGVTGPVSRSQGSDRRLRDP